MALAPYTCTSDFSPGNFKLPAVNYAAPIKAQSNITPSFGSALKWYAPLGIVPDLKTIPVQQTGFGPTNGTMSGTVTDISVPVANVVVRCYYRPTGQLIQTAGTNASGVFTFTNLDPTDTQNYFVVAFEPNSRDAGWSGNQYNAVIFDLLTPV